MLPQFMQAPCGQREPEFMAWAALVRAYDCKSYVELGTGHADYMALMGMKVVAVDINNDEGRVNHNGVHYVRGDSHARSTIDRVLHLLGDLPDAVFIDADHDNDAPRLDFDLWYSVAQKLVGFHDILIPNIAERIWPQIALERPSAKIIGCDRASALAWQGPDAPQDGILSGGGIGVIYKV